MPNFKKAWIENYPELERNGDQVYCNACSKIISCKKKFQIDQHVKTFNHRSKAEKMENAEDKSKNDQLAFIRDLSRALLAANIPLNKLKNQHLREFLKKYCKLDVPDDSELKKIIFTDTCDNTNGDSVKCDNNYERSDNSYGIKTEYNSEDDTFCNITEVAFIKTEKSEIFDYV